MRVQWCPGMRFKMAFETEDSSRISWFMGTISSVQVADPIRWPNSPWRLLQVTWDEPDLLQNVKRVSPWLVELVSNMPTIHLPPFSPPRKKLCVPQHPGGFPLEAQLQGPAFHGSPFGPVSSPLCCFPDSAPAGIQGARHAHLGLSISDLHLSKLQSSLFAAAPPARISTGLIVSNSPIRENISCLLTIGSPSQPTKKSENGKTPQLFVRRNPEKTANVSDGSGSAVNQNGHAENSSCEELVAGQCKVFMDSEDVGRTLDLSVLGSYEELYRRLGDMFGIDRAELTSHVRYRDAAGAVKHAGDEPFSEFMRSARRLTIVTDAGSDNLGR
uniref:PB1 domain-containing protein n=1 Tax=Ananas comosus var. bracteatus TaxID=296719 RepID=A0A6V7QL79_ANACO|nr:unnamed protein product [Ananas comosus var. bracteatus]